MRMVPITVAGGTTDGGGGVEVVVVVAVVPVLEDVPAMALVVSLIVGVSKYANRAAKENAARSELQRIANILQDYFVNQGRYPSSLSAVSNELSDALSRWSQGFPMDPWQNPYYYTNSSEYSYVLLSRGPDGHMGTAATDADNINASGK